MKPPFDTHAISPREYRRAHSFKRQNGYVYVGLLVTGLILAYIRSDPAIEISGNELVLRFGWMVMFAGFFVALDFLASQRWRVDSEGIHEFRWRRKRSIPWEAFEQGKVWRSRSEGELKFKDELGDDVRIWLYLLEDIDRKAILDLVNQVWCPPVVALPAEPVAITIKHQGIRRPWSLKMQWSTEGIYLGRRSQFIPWAAITEVLVTREWRGQQGFCLLDIRTPDKSFWLQDSCFVEMFRQFRPNFQGVEATTLLRILEEYVPKDRLHIGYLDGEPQTAGDRMVQLRCFGARLREASILIALMGSATVWYLFFCDCGDSSRFDVDYLPLGMGLGLMTIFAIFLIACTLAIGLGLYEYLKLLRRYLRLRGQ